MELQFTQKSFKSQAKKLHNAMKARGVECKLSAAQESLAISYGYENLATLYGAFKSDDARYVDATELRNQKNNKFVISWGWEDENDGEETMCIFPPGTNLSGFGRPTWGQADDIWDKKLFIPEGVVFSEETVVLENFSEIPNVYKYGLHDAANDAKVNKWVFDWLGFRVPTTGVRVDFTDRGDDGTTRDHLLVWLNDADAELVRSWFNQ